MARLAHASLISTSLAQTTLTETLQQRLSAVVAQFSSQCPNLALSFAWKGTDLEVAVASGANSANGQVVTVNDTYLFGSGTKPFTAAAVMRMIDQGLVKANDKAYTYIDPYLARHGKPPLAAIFGEEIHNSTVLELVDMSAGIRDFEASYDFDNRVLADGDRWWDYPFEAMNWSVSEVNIAAGGGNDTLLCQPGTCIAYSSTSYEVAGLLLASVLQPDKPWYDFDLGSAIFDDRSKVPSMVFPPLGNSTGARLSEYLSIPGVSESENWGTAVIHDQDPSFLGWTCGNMVATPTDVAGFFYSLLHPGAPDQLVSDTSRARMTDLRKTTAGWLAGDLYYGAGLMAVGAGSRQGKARLSGIGHDGETYGFKSANGYIAELEGAFSLSTNYDSGYGGYAHYYAECYMLEEIKRFVTGNSSFTMCSSLDGMDAAVVV